MNDELDDSPSPDTPPRGGRPRVPDPTTPVTTWIPVSEHARIQKVAEKAGLSISAYIRTILERRKP